MPQIPYSPVPDNTLQGTPTPQMHPVAPEEAFGLGIANSLKGASRSMEKAGDEIWQRAVALQTMQNDANAKEADTKYMMAAGQLHADYNSLEGKAAVDAYPKYVEDLEGIRRTIRNELPNAATQKLYDGSSRGTMARTVFNGAGHAATENKKWASGASAARIGAVKDAALQSPLDDASFKAGLATVEEEVLSQANLHGWSQEQYLNESRKQVSDMWSMRIAGLVKTNPIAAKKMFDEATERGDIRGEQIGKVNNLVQGGLWNQGSRNISSQVRSGSDGYWGSRIVPIDFARKAIGDTEGSNSYNPPHPKWFDKKRKMEVYALGKYGVMNYNLAPWLAEAGMPKMSEADFIKSPKAQDQLFNFKFGQYMEQGGSFNEAASMWLTGTTIANARAKKLRDPLGTDVDEYIRRANGHLARNVPLADKVARGKQVANEIAPDDPMMEDYTVNRIESDHARDLRIKKDDEYNNRQIIEAALMGDKDGKLPTTVDEIKAQGPEQEAAWNALPYDKQRRYLRNLVQNSKGDVSWTEENMRSYQKYKGMAQSDPVEFLALDVPGLELPISARKELINLQGKIKAKAETDPRVTRALQILGPQLQAAGVTKDRKDDYYQFVGALQDGLQDLQGETKKTPTIEEVKLLGSRLLQTKAGTGFWGFGQQQMYNIKPPTKEYDAIKNDPKWQELGIVPTDEQINRIYSRKVFNDLYGKKGKVKEPQKEAAGPQAPVSK